MRVASVDLGTNSTRLLVADTNNSRVLVWLTFPTTNGQAADFVLGQPDFTTGTPGVGGFLWQEYNSLIYAHILLAILTIGLIGFVLDRLMGYAEGKLRTV